MIKTDVREIIMKNKVLYFLLATSLTAFLLVGCGVESTDISASDTTQTETTEVAEEPSTEEQTESEEQPTETVEQTEEATPEQTEEPEATTEPTEEPAPTEAEETETQYTYTDLSQTMYAKQSVNVRSLPSTDGEKLGGLSTAQEVAVTGQCNETSWYRIEAWKKTCK